MKFDTSEKKPEDFSTPRMKALEGIVRRSLNYPQILSSSKTALRNGKLPALYRKLNNCMTRQYRVLDIGSGYAAPLVLEWARSRCREIFCWDPNPETGCCLPTELLEYLKDPVDAVTCSNVINTLPEPMRDDLLLLMALAVKPQGWCCLSSYRGNGKKRMAMSSKGTLQANQPDLRDWLIRSHKAEELFSYMWQVENKSTCSLWGTWYERAISWHERRCRLRPKAELVEA